MIIVLIKNAADAAYGC